MLDHLTKGRFYAGFARGYQDRWVNVLGQQYHATGAPMDGSAIDQHNREVYEEVLEIIRKAWTEESITTMASITRFRIPTRRAFNAGQWPNGRGSTGRPARSTSRGGAQN